MRFGVVIFPGSNCDHDLIYLLQEVYQQEVVELWHKDTDLKGLGTGDCILLPGGFSYGDYLRCGAVARFSPIMELVVAHANAGGYVWGICNGFQILCEAGLLPGALLRNAEQRFICKNVWLKPEADDTAITLACDPEQPLLIPIAHAEGRYYCDNTKLESLRANNQILFRYCDENGNISDASNPNGTTDNIAGICNAGRNVFGMMPHPERCADSRLGNMDGSLLFESLLAFSQQDILGEMAL
jgi:phosphoribosylformylglycinamidine synthase subunit PurQ / glutaminase